MRLAVRLALAVASSGEWLGYDAGNASRLEIRLAVPARVTAAAVARAAGDASAPAPILILEGVRLAVGERVNVRVYGEGPRLLLGVAETVGSGEAAPADSDQRLTLVIPLNDAAAELIAVRKKVTLTLIVERSGGKDVPLVLRRAYFDDGPPP